jgi:hypothetical protein
MDVLWLFLDWGCWRIAHQQNDGETEGCYRWIKDQAGPQHGWL